MPSSFRLASIEGITACIRWLGSLVVGLTIITCLGCRERTNSTIAAPQESVPVKSAQFPPLTKVYQPADAESNSKLPVLVALHGMWSLPKDFLGDDWQEYANELKAVIVTVSAPLPQNAKEYNWSDQVEVNHVRIQSTIDEQLKTVPHRRDRVFLIGYSQGAFASLNLGLTYPEHYAGVIAISPGSLANLPVPAASSPLKNHGFVLCYGGKDEPAWIQQGLDRMNQAKQRLATTEIKKYPKDEHLIPPDLDELLPKWFAMLTRLADQK